MHTRQLQMSDSQVHEYCVVIQPLHSVQLLCEPGALAHPDIEPTSLALPGRFFATEPPGETKVQG